ncbi:hypothetical protein CMI46_01395 [Candidatus Pacearchaeota archaeon]|nr:hypothetical protein [Candidatus Pacearchaeota archaeon]|tara:strand:- start:31548 stop:32528 length:981 start_codon:yes stop_codon:yes gene_type:complete
MEKEKYKFKIDRDRLKRVILAVHDSFSKREGFFSDDYKRFLPQWSLPEEFEYNPQRTQPRQKLMAAKYLWTEAFFERRNQSAEIIKNARKVWDASDMRWFFEPEEVVKRSEGRAENIIFYDFRYALTREAEEPNGKKYLDNAEKLVQEFGGDPRNLINGQTVDQARKNIMEFKGIGTGIANLYIEYLLDRRIASPLDPENAMTKVDIYKAKIPLNTDVILLENGHGEVRRDQVVEALEPSYRDCVKGLGFNMPTIGTALWLIGTRGCREKNFNVCKHCPLEESLCVSNTWEDALTVRLRVFDEEGNRVEMRERGLQGVFMFANDLK